MHPWSTAPSLSSAQISIVFFVEEGLGILFGECFGEGCIGFPIGSEDIAPND